MGAPARPLRRLSPRELRGFDAAVAASLAILIAAGAALGIGWLASRQTRHLTYLPMSAVNRVVLDVSAGDVTVAGGALTGVNVERTEDFAFGREPRELRSLAGGVLHVRSSCPVIVVGSCSASYRLTVPDNVAVSVRTGGGDVHLAGFRGGARVETRSGSVVVDAYCGFRLTATTVSGDITVNAACAPKTLELNSRSGRIAALVPPGRYRVHAVSASGRERVSGVTASDAAPFTIDLHSGSGDVSLVGGL